MSISHQFTLNNKVIIVTGGTGVLGESFVLALAEAEAIIAVLGRDQEKGAKRVAQVKEIGGEAAFFETDVLKEAELIKTKEQILKKWGQIDGLVNAAGGNISGATIGPEEDLFDHNVENTVKAVNLNLFGSVKPTFVFGEEMVKSGRGSIVNISSLASSRPLTRVLGYTMAKHAINGFTKWMASELPLRYGDGIRCNAMAPGVFLTTQNKDLLTNPDGSYSKRAQQFVDGTPYSRLGKPEELKGTLIYLLSDASKLVNGEILFVDGGFNAFSGV